MSHLLALLNRLKAEAHQRLLTDSQAAAFGRLQRLWRFPGRVNLWGPPGSGKTILGWVVARAAGASFYASPRLLRESSRRDDSQIVVDNVPSEPIRLREVIGELQLRVTNTALLITSFPNRIGLTSVQLGTPNVTDVDIVYRNLSLLDLYSLEPFYSTNLWAVVQSVLP